MLKNSRQLFSPFDDLSAENRARTHAIEDIFADDTLPTSAIGPKIGELGGATMLKIDECLKASLGIP